MTPWPEVRFVSKKTTSFQKTFLALALSIAAPGALASPSTVAPEHAPSVVSQERPHEMAAAEHEGRHKQLTEAELQQKKELEEGKVVVGIRDVGKTKFVTGKILIDEPPHKVWPIMVNPFEFQGKISPRTKKVEVFTDETNLSVMKMTMDTSPIPFIPQVSYTVESRYEQTDKGGHIDFRRLSGIIKDFRGCWDMAPADGGRKTELSYSMYIDPGFFVPQLIVREAVKGELPRTLSALRSRIMGVYEGEEKPEHHTIVAATPRAMHHTVY